MCEDYETENDATNQMQNTSKSALYEELLLLLQKKTLQISYL